jgi:hypothetical protein
VRCDENLPAGAGYGGNVRILVIIVEIKRTMEDFPFAKGESFFTFPAGNPFGIVPINEDMPW